MQSQHMQSTPANEQYPRKSQETTIWNRIKSQFSNKTPDRGKHYSSNGKHNATPLIYIEPHIDDTKMQQSDGRRQRRENIDSAYLSPHRTPHSPQHIKPNQSKSDQMLSRLLKDQLQLAYNDHQNNVRCAQSQEALRQLRHSQPRLELTPSSSRHVSPIRKSKSQNSSPSISRRSLSPINPALLDVGSSGSENSYSSNHSAPPRYYQNVRSKSCTPSRTQSPSGGHRHHERLSFSNGPTRQSSARNIHQLNSVDSPLASAGSGELVKQAQINLIWAFILEAVNTAEMEDFNESDPKQWWRKLFRTLKLMHGKAKASSIAGQLMGNPMVLEAIQNKLSGMVGDSSGYLESLPESVQKRIKALKKLQFECTKIEAEFCEEIHKLECKFAERYSPIYTKRREIITGAYEPNEVECDWPSDEEEDDDDDEQEVEAKKKKKVPEPEEPTKGIQSFWATTFKNAEILGNMIEEHDEPILDSLADIKLTFSQKPMGFTLHFEFDENEYFTNKVLTKTYVMQSVADENDPFGFEGPEIVSCQGCKIHWKKGKNITMASLQKKQKNAKTGSIRVVTKEVQNDSFFNFFSPPPVPEDSKDDIDEETQSLLQADFQIGHFIRERIIPHAVLFFTGEANDDDEDGDSEDEEDDDYDDYDEDGDPDYDPSKDPGKQCKNQ